MFRPYTLHARSWPKLRLRALQPACDVSAMAVAANTEEQAAQVQAAHAAGFGPHMPLQITGVKQTPELNGLLCQMEDLRNHPVFPATLSSAPVPCLMRACRPAIPSRVLSHLAEAQGLAGPHPRAHCRERGRHRCQQPGRHAARPPTQASAFTASALPDPRQASWSSSRSGG